MEICSCHAADVTKIDAIRIMKCGPEDMWEKLRRDKKMSARDAYYRVVDCYPRDAVYKGYTYPQVRESTLCTYFL